MSINRNRSVTVNAQNRREYTILEKSWKVYCTICNKRAGMFDAYCGPRSNKQLKNWKQFRKTKYKMKRKRIS